MVSEESEYMHQVRFVAWFRNRHPSLIIFHIPNGGGRSKAEGARMKNMGVLAGVPDLFIPALKLFIEMKTESGGKTSDSQLKVMKWLEQSGYECHVCNGFESAKKLIAMALD